MSMHTGTMMIDEGETKKPVAHNPLEQFLLLAKGTKGAACQDLIKTVLEAPGVYVFSELLAQPNIKEVRFYCQFYCQKMHACKNYRRICATIC